MRRYYFVAIVSIACLLNCQNLYAQGKGKGKANQHQQTAATSNAKKENNKNGMRGFEAGKHNSSLESTEGSMASPPQKSKIDHENLPKKEQPKGRVDKASNQKKQEASDIQNQGKGKNYRQQQNALMKQFQHENAKHLRRRARLERIRELAVAKGDPKLIERVGKLITMEADRYTRKREQMNQRQSETVSAGTIVPINTSEKADTKGKSTENKAKPNKPLKSNDDNELTESED